MKDEEDRRIIIKTQSSNGEWVLWLIMAILIILFSGDPDLMDALIAYIQSLAVKS